MCHDGCIYADYTGTCHPVNGVYACESDDFLTEPEGEVIDMFDINYINELQEQLKVCLLGASNLSTKQKDIVDDVYWSFGVVLDAADKVNAKLTDTLAAGDTELSLQTARKEMLQLEKELEEACARAACAEQKVEALTQHLSRDEAGGSMAIPFAETLKIEAA